MLRQFVCGPIAIGNDHHGKLKAFGLVDGHQANGFHPFGLFHRLFFALLLPPFDQIDRIRTLLSALVNTLRKEAPQIGVRASLEAEHPDPVLQQFMCAQ